MSSETGGFKRGYENFTDLPFQLLHNVLTYPDVPDGERIWAGVEGVYGGVTSMMEPTPTAQGSLCYYTAREGEDKWREAETFKWV